MRFRVAFVEESEGPVALVEVEAALFQDAPQLERLHDVLRYRQFRGTPVVMMARSADGHRDFHGRPDLVARLGRAGLHGLIWRENQQAS